MKLLLTLCLFIPAAAAGIITSGQISSQRVFSGASDFRLNFAGSNLNGNPYSINLVGLTPASTFIGNQRCPSDAGGAPNSFNCTWGFAQTYVINSSQANVISPGEITWDGFGYDFTSGSPYQAVFDFAVTASPITIGSTFSNTPSGHTWTFPLAPASVSIALTIKQGANILVSESLMGDFSYSGSAYQAPTGSNWLVGIQYNAVPEPATLLTCALSLIAVAAVRRRAR